MAELFFTGPFQKEMKDFISLKRSVGYKYNTEPGILKRFNSYLAAKYPEADALSKDAVTGWCSKTIHESAANHCSRASVIRQFSKYLDSIGIRAWILPKNYYSAGQQYVLHIYTPDELRRFFSETDKCCYCSEVPYRHLVMPESMTLRLIRYAGQVHPFPEPERYFFPGCGGKAMTLGNVYKNFRRFLWKAGISHTGDGPRVHDFRYPNVWISGDTHLLSGHSNRWSTRGWTCMWRSPCFQPIWAIRRFTLQSGMCG